jgi:3-mercaptopyruvate sulfurtransferase SseA
LYFFIFNYIKNKINKNKKNKNIYANSFIPNAIPFNIYTLNKQSQTPCSNPNINFVMKDEIGLKGALGDRGISKDSNVVVYDSSTGSFGRGNLATYVLWVLEMVGHDITKLYLLNGQFKQWIADGGVAGTPGTPTPITYDPKNEQTFNSSLNTTGCFIKQYLTDPNHVWLATIPPTEFAGHHIPCAVQIDFEANLITPGTTGDWRFKTPSALEAIYITQNDVTRDRYISTY